MYFFCPDFLNGKRQIGLFHSVLSTVMDITGSGFTRKKVASFTLGEKLQKIRIEHRMSLVEVSRATKIQVKYLEAIEKGVYTALPAEVYVRGFLRGYARCLGCDEAAILRLYEREQEIQASLGATPQTVDTKRLSGVKWPVFVVTARMVWAMIITVAVLVTFVYLFREYYAFVSAPRLIIHEPIDQDIVFHADLFVRGETDKRARVSINGEPVSVDAEGNFVEKLLLQPGLNIIDISAVNRFEKERRETIRIDAAFIPEQAVHDEDSLTPEAQHRVSLVVSAPEQTIQITVLADGIKVWSGALVSGEKKSITAEREISLSSDNGRATYVEVGSEPARALSAEEQPVKDVLFAAQP